MTPARVPRSALLLLALAALCSGAPLSADAALTDRECADAPFCERASPCTTVCNAVISVLRDGDELSLSVPTTACGGAFELTYTGLVPDVGEHCYRGFLNARIHH